MPKKYRLSRADFQNMRAFRRVIGEYFSLSYGELPNRPFPGAACVVSSKVASRAVDRNRIKRRARAALSEYIQVHPRPTVVLYAKKGATKASFADIQKDIENLLSKI